MGKFIGQKVVFIPDVEKNGYGIGHTGNYLLVKYSGCNKLIHDDVETLITSVEYPYVIGE